MATLPLFLHYDSVRSGKRAKKLCDRLGQQLAPDCELNLCIWRLSALQLLPPLARAAARETERTNLLIVAVDGDKTLPRPVKSCLHWCARGTRVATGALVAQLHGILKMNEELCPVVGTSRCDVRAACSGATPSSAIVARIFIPPATARAGTAQRAVPTIALNTYSRLTAEGIPIPNR